MLPMTARRVHFAGALLLATCAACAPIEPPNIGPFAPPEPQVLVVGEIHGTQEAPAWFEKEVRRLAVDGRRLSVGLELSNADLASACPALAARSAQGRWFDDVQDGRTSQSMAGLACALTQLQDERKIKLFALVDDSKPLPRAQRYAGVIRENLTTPGSTALVLAGNLHARHVPSSMTGILETAGISVRTVTVSSAATGKAWTCNQDSTCGVAPIDSLFCPVTNSNRRYPEYIADVSGRWNYCLVFPTLTPSLPLANRIVPQ